MTTEYAETMLPGTLVGWYYKDQIQELGVVTGWGRECFEDDDDRPEPFVRIFWCSSSYPEFMKHLMHDLEERYIRIIA